MKSSISASHTDGKLLQTEIASLKQLLTAAQQEKGNAEKRTREIDSENTELQNEKKRLGEQVATLSAFKEKSEEYARQLVELKDKLEAAEKEAEKALQQKESAVKLHQKELDLLKRDVEQGKSSNASSSAAIEVSHSCFAVYFPFLSIFTFLALFRRRYFSSHFFLSFLTWRSQRSSTRS